MTFGNIPRPLSLKRRACRLRHQVVIRSVAIKLASKLNLEVVDGIREVASNVGCRNVNPCLIQLRELVNVPDANMSHES